jgi:hypothetical protein
MSGLGDLLENGGEVLENGLVRESEDGAAQRDSR